MRLSTWTGPARSFHSDWAEYKIMNIINALSDLNPEIRSYKQQLILACSIVSNCRPIHPSGDDKKDKRRLLRCILRGVQLVNNS
jgi:hypothetical protein